MWFLFVLLTNSLMNMNVRVGRCSCLKVVVQLPVCSAHPLLHLLEQVCSINQTSSIDLRSEKDRLFCSVLRVKIEMSCIA